MAISKTDFINFSRCPRYAALNEVKKNMLEADISYEKYKNDELFEKINELYNGMYEEDESGNIESLLDIIDPQMEAMLKYYRKVEELAAKVTLKYFGGKVKSSNDTFSQECFDFNKNGIKYLCYVDIYNEVEKHINIIEVKATTSKKFLNLGKKEKGAIKHSIFEKINNVYHLKNEIGYDYSKELSEKAYLNYKSKLYDRFAEGKYVYDLAVQRYFIENEYKNSHNEEKISQINYYLAVLNHEYIYDGESDYDADENGNDIISFFDMNLITKELQEHVDLDCQKIERYIKESNGKACPLGDFCERKKPSECKFFKQICGHIIPKYNSSLNYFDNPAGFKDEYGAHHQGLDLINEGYINMLDIPDKWISNPNHTIERNALITQKPFINVDKLKDIINGLNYPIYHLDFETFPCPIPRFKGEKCYEQSPFEFSLHIEHSPGLCDKEKDNYIFLAHSFKDEREDLVKMLCKYIDPSKGTLFAQNVGFEKRCIKRLSEIYPLYRNQLMKMHAIGFDLIYILKTNKEYYRELGYKEEDAKVVNYYDYRFSGSYSIKKTLPVFSDLSYADLDVKNGVEAIREYSTFDHITKEELTLRRKWLKDYCQQDTWAMVVILDALRKNVNEMSKNSK